MTIRVAMLCADLGVGGIQSMADSLGRGLDRARFEPSFVCFDSLGPLGDRLAADGFPVRRVTRRPGIDFALARSLARTFRELRADVVHAHNRTALFYAVLARGFSARPRLVYTEHDRSFPEALKVRVLHAVLARRVDAVAAVCGAVRDAIVSTERFPDSRTHVVVNGVTDPGGPLDGAAAASVRADVRAEFGALVGARLVLAVGHLTAVKDHETLLRALAAIPVEDRPVLVIAGDGDRRPALESLCAELGLASHVRLPGYRRDIDRLLRACDVLVMSSVSEGLSIALVEAAARGVPIIATQVGGNSEVVADGENGMLVPSRDPARLADAIVRLITDSAARVRMGVAGRARYLERFRIETMLRRYEAIYSEVAGAASRGAGA